MHTFSVWAPAASSVDLVLRDGVLPMRWAADGWWKREVVEAHHGTDYAFSIDGGEPLPDPRSPWQPDGVHGFSRVFDAGRFTWTDEDWIGRDVRGSVSGGGVGLRAKGAAVVSSSGSSTAAKRSSNSAMRLSSSSS